MGNKQKRISPVIGRRDRIDLPELDLMEVEAKIDTGAYTSALHVQRIKLIEKDNEPWVRFQMKHPSHPSFNNKIYEFPVRNEKRVKNSSGKMEKRVTIRTRVLLFGKPYKVEFSLTNRAKMECPVLIGRKLLYRRYLVDVSQKDLSYQQKITKTKPE
jgi:hypothetical protein